MIKKNYFTVFSSVFKVGKIFFTIVFLIGIFLSCDEDPSKLGLELLPDDDFNEVGLIDTISMETFTTGETKIPSTNYSIFPIGDFLDPVFGVTQSEIIIQFSPTGYRELGDNLVVDSVILVMTVNDLYGDTVDYPQLEVYRLLSDLTDSIYYSDTDPMGLFEPENFAKSNPYTTDTTHFIVQLENSFGELLINPFLEADSSYFIYDSVFNNYFKGLYIKPNHNNPNNTLFYCNDARIDVYFTSDLTTSSSSISFAYNPLHQIPDKVISLLNHNYNEATITEILDPPIQDTVVYLQSLGGTQGLLKFPYLEDLRDQLEKVLINKAELILYVLNDSIEMENYPIPTQLGMKFTNGEPLPDDMVTAGTYSSQLNGLYYTDIKGYRFAITQYFQDYFNRDTDITEFSLYPGYIGFYSTSIGTNPSRYKRVMLGSGKHPTKKPVIRIVYTKL